MAPDEARHLVIEGINYAAYYETDFSLQDSDKNRIFGSEHYASGRPVHESSPWAEGDFEEKMAMLVVWANVLNRSVPAFTEAQKLLESEDSVVGRIIRSAKTRKTTDIAPGTKFYPLWFLIAQPDIWFWPDSKFPVTAFQALLEVLRQFKVTETFLSSLVSKEGPDSSVRKPEGGLCSKLKGFPSFTARFRPFKT
jgi:hypothetical protein